MAKDAPQFGVSISVPDLTPERAEKLVEGLHFHAPEIAEEILEHIELRTPVYTGALREDAAYTLGGKNSKTLVSWYLGQEYQIAEWGRFYGQYQEGVPLGQQGWTYRGRPNRMFQHVTDQDMPFIEAWANASVKEGVDAMAKDAQVNATTEVDSL